jgi:glucoselysine-6-phosphate deglycase
MALTMYDYYLSQPEYMRRIFNNKDKNLGAFKAFYGGRNPSRIYLCGSGTSFHACSSAREYMQQMTGREVTVVTPTNKSALEGERPIAILVSQSGRSTNTLEALKRYQDKGIPAVSLTFSTDTPVAQAGGLPLVLDVDDETAGPKTRGYTGTVLSLYLMALIAALETKDISESEYNQQLGHISQAIDASAENQRRCAAFFDPLFEALKPANNYMFVGKGPAMAVAGESALKELETLCYPASAYEFEEYLHGPACCVDERSALFLFLSGDGDLPRMQRLTEIIKAATRNVYHVTYDENLRGENILNLTSPDPYYMSPFSSIFPGQYLSAKLPGAYGRVRHPAASDIFTKMDTKVVI